MKKSGLLRQFTLWFLLLVVLPAVLLAIHAFYQVKSYAENDMRTALAFDLEKAELSTDVAWNDCSGFFQALVSSQDINRTLVAMRAAIANGQTAKALYIGKYELGAQLSALLADASAIEHIVVFMEDRCVYSSSGYLSAQRSLQGELSAVAPNSSATDIRYIGWRSVPFGAFEGDYLTAARNIQDYWNANARERLCTVVLLLPQQRLTELLDAPLRYDDSIAGVFAEGELLAASTSAASERALLVKAASLAGDDTAVLEGEAGFVRVNRQSIKSQETGMYYVQLSSTEHIDAIVAPVFQLVYIWIGISLVTLMLFAAILSRNVLRPTIELSKAMKCLERNDFHKRLNPASVHNGELSVVFSGFNQMSEGLRSSFEKLRVEEVEKRRHQLTMLRYQINPHFLHNTLNAIRFSAMKHGDEETAAMLVTLSRLLRRALNSAAPFLPLEEELDNLRDYVSLQQLRYGGALCFEIDTTQLPSGLYVPMMLFQPLIENAITHGLSDALNTGGDARIWLEGRVDDATVIFTVRDNGCGINPEKLSELLRGGEDAANANRHIGLSNIHHRLRLMFGEEYGLRLESEEGKQTVVTVLLPRLYDAEYAAL